MINKIIKYYKKKKHKKTLSYLRLERENCYEKDVGKITYSSNIIN
jgi:hypothetical protein